MLEQVDQEGRDRLVLDRAQGQEARSTDPHVVVLVGELFDERLTTRLAADRQRTDRREANLDLRSGSCEVGEDASMSLGSAHAEVANEGRLESSRVRAAELAEN